MSDVHENAKKTGDHAPVRAANSSKTSMEDQQIQDDLLQLLDENGCYKKGTNFSGAADPFIDKKAEKYPLPRGVASYNAEAFFCQFRYLAGLLEKKYSTEDVPLPSEDTLWMNVLYSATLGGIVCMPTVHEEARTHEKEESAFVVRFDSH